ncbi:glycosyltransferase [Vibrio vulnificus]|nr:glycosyltransferase family 4 protein [Vibrio vulnificus]EIZ1171837.1 glycosyltransferase [Vibrio vulnificus]EKG2460217.1 glycosyltransferase [Vibrio vulnificus]
MIKIVIVADFELSRTGILSTASNLLHYWEEDFEVYSNQEVKIRNKVCLNLEQLKYSAEDKMVIFSHIECKILPQLIESYPESMVHVGDWPGNYWASLKAINQNIKGFLGDIRFKYRVSSIPKSAKLVFVSHSDTDSAIKSGYINSKTIEIGVVKPTNCPGESINCNTIVFTGNFRYAPNKLAANELIKFANKNKNVTLALVGFYANELEIENCKNDNIECYNDVDSIPNFLNENRFVYVSPIKVGAGAKNKILEAIISGCPVIATIESLDPSIDKIESIQIISDLSEVTCILEKMNQNLEYYVNLTEKMREFISKHRTWKAMSDKMRNLLYET